MPDAQEAIVTSIIVFILAFVGIYVLGSLPPVDGSLSEEAAQLRIEIANVLVVMATLLGGVTFYIITKMGAMR